MIAGRPFNHANPARPAPPMRDLRNLGASLTTLAHACVSEHLHQLTTRDQAARLRELCAVESPSPREGLGRVSQDQQTSKATQQQMNAQGPGQTGLDLLLC
jgi:hypothetical protein